MTLRRWLVVSLAVASTCVGLASLSCSRTRAEDSSTVSASDVGRAEKYAADAFDAYSHKQFPAAIALYLKAWEAAPTADILYNLARIYDGKLKDRTLAIDYYRRYIRDPGAEPTRLRAASDRLSQLLELEAISTEASRARPPSELPYNAETKRDPRGRDDVGTQEGGINGLHVLGIVALTAGVAGLGVGAGFGLAAKSDADIAADFCSGNACNSQRGVDASRDAATSASISTIAFVAGGVLSAVGVVTLIVASSRGGRERERASLSLAPVAGPSMIGTRLSGQW